MDVEMKADEPKPAATTTTTTTTAPPDVRFEVRRWAAVALWA